MRTSTEKLFAVYDLRAEMKPKITALVHRLERQIKLNEAIQFPQ
jgi:hypothetical protein